MHTPLSAEEVAECNREQMKAMEVHKYIESEKANKNVGSAAYIEWIDLYAASWRAEWMRRRAQRNEEDTPDTDTAPGNSCCPGQHTCGLPQQGREMQDANGPVRQTTE